MRRQGYRETVARKVLLLRGSPPCRSMKRFWNKNLKLANNRPPERAAKGLLRKIQKLHLNRNTRIRLNVYFNICSFLSLCILYKNIY